MCPRTLTHGSRRAELVRLAKCPMPLKRRLTRECQARSPFHPPEIVAIDYGAWPLQVLTVHMSSRSWPAKELMK